MLGDKVFLKLNKPEERTVNGVILPAVVENLGEHYRTATVYGFGDGKKIHRSAERYPLDNFNLGDKVIIPKFAGTRVEIEGEEYTVVSAHDIYGVVEE